jgi:hypothetical protein
LAIISACHLWLVVQDRLHGHQLIFDHRSDATIQGITKHAARVSQWKITELRAIDSQRIYMHDTTGYGDLNARQCCSVESAAKNNPQREIQLFVSRRELNDDQQQKLLDTNSSLTPWQTVLQHYPNVEVISYDEAEYFNDTTLEPWYTEGQWQQSRQPEFYLSEYVRAMSLFRGGGLYLDLDSVLSLKPLTGSKWQNFFVVRRNDRVEYETSTSNKVFHLLHGHHLIDMLILKLVEAGDELQAEPFATALDASLERICNFKDNGLLDPGNNQCVDVRLSEERDVFLQPLDTLFSKRSFSRLKENGVGGVNEQSVKQLIKTVVDAQEAVLMTWDSIATILHRNKTFFESPGYFSVTGKTLLSTLIAENCPLTAARETNFI